MTGGSSGIGQAIAVRLGHEGADLAIIYVGPLEADEETRDAIEADMRACVDPARNATYV